jgi:protein O-mannosyl-transferase
MTTLMDSINGIFSSKRFNLIALCIIAGLILIAYSNTFTASFHFDDNPAIIENPNVRHVTMDNIMTLIRGGRPVVNLSIMLNYQLNGMDVVGYHIFNIATHILNSVLVYFLVLGTLRLPQLLDRYKGKAQWMALFCALLFGVHPVQTESVTYIISRSELLATCFYLAAFLLLIKGARSGNFLYAVAVMIASLLAMSSKEWAVTVPALLVLYDFLFLADGKIQPVLSRWYYYVLAALPWILVIQKLNLFATGGTAGVGFSVVSATGITAKSYLYTSFNVIWTYIRLLFLPINQNLDYDYPIAKTLFELPTILSFAGHLAIIAASVWLYRTRKWTLVPFGVAWFYIGLSPVQSFVPVIDVIFEHRLYMPSIGFFLAFIVLYEAVFDWMEKRKATAVAS